eukprot:548277-Pyramimonas_sp.AAC.1
MFMYWACFARTAYKSTPVLYVRRVRGLLAGCGVCDAVQKYNAWQAFTYRHTLPIVSTFCTRMQSVITRQHYQSATLQPQELIRRCGSRSAHACAGAKQSHLQSACITASHVAAEVLRLARRLARSRQENERAASVHASYN